MERTTDPVIPHADPATRILLVDDDPGILSAYARILRATGHRVWTAEDVISAVTSLAEIEVDVVITDMGLPDGTGLDVLEAVQASGHETPVIFATASNEAVIAVQALERGAHRYLIKPVDPATLARAVESARRLADRATPVPSGRELGQLDVRFDAALAGLSLVRQPLVAYARREVIGHEVLVRTREASLRRPERLVAAAEALGRLNELGRAIRALAAPMVADLAPGQVLHVNLHPYDLADDELYDPAAPLSRVAHAVVLELTERQLLDRLGDVGARVERLRALGFRVALDDLGAGYGSLASVALVHPDIIKLDSSLVRGVGRDPVRRQLVAALANAFRALGLPMICEGVEDRVDLDALVEIGVDRFQGFLFGKPGHGAEVTWPPEHRPLARGTDDVHRTVDFGGPNEMARMVAREARSAAVEGRLSDVTATLDTLIELIEAGPRG